MLCCPVCAPESSRLGYGVTKEHHIGFQYATTAGAGWEVEVLASTLQLHITVWPPDWNVNFAIWLHDHIALLFNTHGRSTHQQGHLNTPKAFVSAKGIFTLNEGLDIVYALTRTGITLLAHGSCALGFSSQYT